MHSVLPHLVLLEAICCHGYTQWDLPIKGHTVQPNPPDRRSFVGIFIAPD